MSLNPLEGQNFSHRKFHTNFDFVHFRRGPVRYRFEVLYLLDQVLPVNIKDRGTTKNSFKVLIFPDTRVFQAPNAKAKVCFQTLSSLLYNFYTFKVKVII